MNRLDAVRQFYGLLDELRQRSGFLALSACDSRQDWPKRGVYFFFEGGQIRSHSGAGPRVVRVGTHALGTGSMTTLWNRLSQHAGTRKAAAGNHRGSIFRLLVGEAIKRRDKRDEPRSWGVGADPGKAAAQLGSTRDEVKMSELSLEKSVSTYICSMPFLFVAAEDDAGPSSVRGEIERNAIALLSNYNGTAIDPATEDWLGRFSGRERVRRSGLWNNNHVDEGWDEGFLAVLAATVKATGRGRNP